jgi:hypothetical protein
MRQANVESDYLFGNLLLRPCFRPRCSEKAALRLSNRSRFSIRFYRFFGLDMSIENLTPKGELQPMRIGYARVSTRDQNLEMQLDALNKAGCKRIFTDKLSGAQVERPGLKEALSHLREADTLVV